MQIDPILSPPSLLPSSLSSLSLSLLPFAPSVAPPLAPPFRSSFEGGEMEPDPLAPPFRSSFEGGEMEPDPLGLLANTAVHFEENPGLTPSIETQEMGSELPINYRDKVQEMHGQALRRVLQKKLTCTDMKRNMLSIPEKKIDRNFLYDTEIASLDRKESIEVSLIEPCLRVSRGLQLKKQNHRATFSYMLGKKWRAVVSHERNELVKDDLIQLWSFRVDDNLWFCLVKVGAAPAAVENIAAHE